ncbi:type II toxin-antitoxin system RelE/ParE family toxin [Serratia plymuthica]|uniref:type II toxin-antitoxin system RelE/ParE family toxin n=1 Tax=Serratia plymuthica TaxID=82996 RepID=UPI001BAE7284|nr:type II toxin-antitoxin system RelE/ParE family toxin [Serratia plymuthica]QUY46974.1 type II toxin-antitoxin system RelE/ParE family toxin [Serratia plymuthica]
MKIKWLRKAASNFDDEYDWFYQESPQVATEFAREVFRLVSLLVSNPALGRAGRVMGTREIVMKTFPYLIPYRIKNNEIHILRIFHMHRRPPKKCW